MGYLTTYVGLFTAGDEGSAAVRTVEIPLIQRDYAQGRTETRVGEIRTRFLDVLHDALVGGEPVGLDFVYGDLDNGTLRPLDGQQRLTTLFLLHWYLGYRAEQLGQVHPWMNFSYATRPSARLFCERLVRAAPPADVVSPAAWVVDQSWYLYIWRHDPTIQGMLVMIEAMHERFGACDPQDAWDRLTSLDDPAISFQVLPIDEVGSGEELYIKMNSRGKPLTPFETFKARLERAMSWSEDKADRFEQSVDGPWADVLWRFRGSDDIVDDEFMRYLAFITDVCEWRAGKVPLRTPFVARALELFGTEGDDAEQSLSFMFHAFDTWVDVEIAEEFKRLFTFTRSATNGEESPPLLLFGVDSRVNLFDACCRSYGIMGRFSYGRTLLLLAVLLDRVDPSDEFPRRLRVLRNLIEASESEFRPHRLPALVADVKTIIVDGSLDEINGFNAAQAEDEQAKWAFLDAHPELADTLFDLEDHDVLHGSLQAFELDSATFEHRAAAFDALLRRPGRLPEVTGALLAAGDYARPRNTRDLQFGAPTLNESWRTLLTGTSRANLTSTASALGAVLDAVATAADLETALAEIQKNFLAERESDRYFDWRYYMVRYPAMREGDSGIYASSGGAMGYHICMLNRTQMNGYYRDPYLTAIVREADAGGVVDDGEEGPFFIGGYVEDHRWMTLRRSGTAMRCSSGGMFVRAPRDEFAEQFLAACVTLGIDEGLKVTVQQQERDDRRVDIEDRVQVGAGVLKTLIEAGL